MGEPREVTVPFSIYIHEKDIGRKAVTSIILQYHWHKSPKSFRSFDGAKNAEELWCQSRRLANRRGRKVREIRPVA